MDTGAFETNFKFVKEQILDEHKLVTYISLSKELCIHVNEAKSLLGQLIIDIRKTQPATELYVCYLISGLQSNNSGCTTVCPETDLDALKKTFKIVFYKHVYCVSRGFKSVDHVALSGINKFEDISLCTGLIKANCCTKRTDNEIGNLKSKNHVVSIELKSPNVLQQTSKDIVNELIKNGHEDATKVNDIKTNPYVKSEILSPKKDVSTKNKTATRKSSNNTAAKGIKCFFNKINGDSVKVKNVKVHEAEFKVEINVKDEQSTIMTAKAAINAPMKNSQDQASSKNSVTQLKKNAKVDKKRKRLLHVSDSESETEENDPFTNTNEPGIDHESEDEIPPTPTANRVKITSGIVNPKKRRKIVDKTYTEDGYILTKKEEVYVSCSENEDELKENTDKIKDNTKVVEVQQIKEKTENVKQCKIVTSPKENKSKKRKVSPPQKGKQSTINSFFKKV